LKSLLAQKIIMPRHLSSVTGKLMSISHAFVHAKVRYMELYTIIDAENRKPWQCNDTIHLTCQALTDITWVLENLKIKNGRLGWKPSHIIPVYVDAFTISWSVTLGSERAFGSWKTNTNARISPRWNQWLYCWDSKHLLWKLQPLDDRFYRQSGCPKNSRSWWQKTLAKRNNERSVEFLRPIRHEFQWVPSELNPADELTRLVDKSDWSLSQELFDEINGSGAFFNRSDGKLPYKESSLIQQSLSLPRGRSHRLLHSKLEKREQLCLPSFSFDPKSD